MTVIAGRSGAGAETLTLASAWQAISGGGFTDELLAWPPDVFALTDVLLDRSEAFRFVFSPPEGAELRRARLGSTTPCYETVGASSRPATTYRPLRCPTTTGPPWKEVPTYSRPACRVCSRSATSGPTRSSVSRLRWEKAARPFVSPNSTLDSRRHGPTQRHRAPWTPRQDMV